jgi:hypothetical protein
MINDNKNIEREGIYKKYFEKFGTDPVTYGLYWNNREAFEKLLEDAIKNGVEYEEKPPDTDVYY